MAADKSNSLIRRPDTGLTSTGRRTSPVITRMTQDVLARARAAELSQARFRIGDYELRGPDYRQILRWAEALGKAPEELLAPLAACRVEPHPWEDWKAVSFKVEDGAILSLAWDLDRSRPPSAPPLRFDGISRPR